MIFEHEDYRMVLKAIMTERARKNPRYSLRSYAKALGLSPSGLSRILSGHKHLSFDRAIQIAKKLGLSNQESEFFLGLVQVDGSKSVEAKHLLLEKVNSFRSEKKVHNLSVDHFKVISDWYHLAILELLGIESVSFAPKEIAAFLGIAPTEAELAIERLRRLELIEGIRGKRPKRAVNSLLVESHVPNDAIRSAYRQILDKAKESVDEQTPKEKVIGAEVFAFDLSQLEEARSLTDRYLNDLQALARKGKRRTHIYQAVAQVFRLNKIPKSSSIKTNGDRKK